MPYKKEDLLGDEDWIKTGKCPLSFYDGDFRYCAIEGKLYGKSPFSGYNPNNTNCDGNIHNCPYTKDIVLDNLELKNKILEQKSAERKNELEKVMKEIMESIQTAKV